jgi:DNA polymerase-3 subunit epsilon
MTAKLWLAILDDIKSQYSIDNIPFKKLQKLAKTHKNSVNKLLEYY